MALSYSLAHVRKIHGAAQSQCVPSSASKALHETSDSRNLSERILITPVEVKTRLAVTPEIQRVVEQKTKEQCKCPLGIN
jgi:hypothetical protein